MTSADIAADPILALTRDARLSPYAMSAMPAWLWAGDASRVVWANAAGATALGVATPIALTERRFAPEEPVAVDVARIAAALPANGAPRLERLRGIGSNLVCTCSRISLPDGSHGILVIASEPARPALPLAERAARMFAASSEPLAVFSAEGALLYATGDLEPETTLATLGAASLKDDAIASGRASGPTALGEMILERIGRGTTTALLATLPDARESAEARSGTTTEQAVIRERPDASVASPPPSIGQPDPTDTPALSPNEDAPTPPERRAPLRFVWTMDAELRFHLAAPAFAEAMGPHTISMIGKPWGEITAALGIDPESRVAHAVASRDTFSGVVIGWPLDPSGETVSVEFSGLPIFDRERNFQGYRGFGVCRHLASAAKQQPQTAASEPTKEPAPKESERPLLTIVPAAKNVVPFRAAAPDKRATLTPVESSAFKEIGVTLTNGEVPPVAPAPPAEAPAQDAIALAREPEAEQ